MLGDFFSGGVAQLNLFDDNAPRAGKCERVDGSMDHLNAKDGKGTLYFYAGQGCRNSGLYEAREM